MARFLHLPSPEEIAEEDPLAGIANLFDVSIVFIVGLMISLFSVYKMADLVDSKSEVTMVKTNAQGAQEIIVKKGTKVTAYKVSGKAMTGQGERLGTAYRLADGQVIYVPEGPADAK
ncbi:MAG: DUF2149 domain-containing protein [Acidobacteriota bacterium]